MELGLKGKSALVLAASTGLGRAIGASFCQEGVKTVICSSSEERINNTAKEIGAHPIVADLDRMSSVEPLAKACSDLIGTPDIIVINCGGPDAGKFLDNPKDIWELNYHRLWGVPVALLQHFLPGMLERGSGRILWVTSIAAQQVVPGITISSSLRGGLHELIKCLSDEYAGRGITVNALIPGYIATDRLKHLETDNVVPGHIPAGRLGRPEEFGDLAAFVASDRAAYISGQCIACDGGWLRS